MPPTPGDLRARQLSAGSAPDPGSRRLPASSSTTVAAASSASGLLSRNRSAALQDAGVPYETLGGVRTKPRLSLVHEGISLVKEEQIDFRPGHQAAEASSTRPRPLPTAHATRARSRDYYMKRKNRSRARLPVGCMASSCRSRRRSEPIASAPSHPDEEGMARGAAFLIIWLLHDSPCWILR